MNELAIGVGLALIFGFLPFLGVKMPGSVTTFGIAIGLCMVALGLLPEHRRPNFIQSALYVVGIGLIAAAVTLQFFTAPKVLDDPSDRLEDSGTNVGRDNETMTMGTDKLIITANQTSEPNGGGENDSRSPSYHYLSQEIKAGVSGTYLYTYQVEIRGNSSPPKFGASVLNEAVSDLWIKPVGPDRLGSPPFSSGADNLGQPVFILANPPLGTYVISFTSNRNDDSLAIGFPP